MGNISGSTGVLAIIGHPVDHSLSPLLHNAALRELGLDLVYTAFDVKDLDTALAGVRALGLRGLSVTIPHKERCLPFLDSVDPMAERIGAVNTIVNRDGCLYGYNTDATGVVAALEEKGVDPGGGTALLLGSGGAARAAAFALIDRFPLLRLTIAGRTPSRRTALAADIATKTGVPVIDTGFSGDILETAALQAALIINATPLGMRGEGNPLAERLFHPDAAFFDIVYTPVRTPFIVAAERAGACWVGGDRMFLHQAAAQFLLWTGQAAPLEVMERTLFSKSAG